MLSAGGKGPGFEVEGGRIIRTLRCETSIGGGGGFVFFVGLFLGGGIDYIDCLK